MARHAEVLRLPMNDSPLLGLAWVLGGIAAFAGVIAMFGGLEDTDRLLWWVAGLALCGAVSAGVRGWVIRNRAPTGLRLDAQGLSGYLIDAPVAWLEIKTVGLVVLGRDTQGVALSLRDPGAYAGRIETMLQPVDLDEPWQYHLTLGQGLAMSHLALLRLLQDWHQRYAGGDGQA